MSKTIAYYFFVLSPFAYLGSGELERIAREHGARVEVKPVSVKTVFAETGGVPPAKRPKARQDYRFVEMRRWSAERGLPIVLQPPYFPVPDEIASCAVLAAAEAGGDALKLAHAVLRAVWAEERDISDPATVRDIVAATGHDADAVMARAGAPETQAAYERLTREAIDRGVFGSPWYIVDGEPFWGQDRLDFVERKVAAERSPAP